MEGEAEAFGRLDPGVGHVVGVTDPRDRLAADAAALLDVGEDIGQHLAGMVFVGQPVDHRHPRMRGKTLDDLLAEGADHDDVDHARDHLRRILDRLAAPQLGVAGVEEDGVATELVDAGLERQARTSRVFLEDHGQRAIVQRMPCLVVLELGLQNPCAVQQVLVLVGSQVAELEVMLDRSWAHKTKKAAR